MATEKVAIYWSVDTSHFSVLLFAVGMHQHLLTKNEQRDIIRRVMRENGVNVRRRDDNRLKIFTVKGEGLFRCCNECGNAWSSYHTSIRVDLSRARVFKRYKQKCQQCSTCWVTPRFTSDRFEEIIKKVIRMHENRKNGYRDNRPAPVHGNTQGPHEQDDCERCVELGRHC